MGQKHALPWWIEGGEETCPFCGRSYAYELERRCAHCDEPVCPWCYIPGEQDELCPECTSCREGDS